MGYINKTSYQLEAYLTQKGRDYFLNGTLSDSKITKFCLGDSDRNYIISEFNFSIPDLSGDNDICLKSLASGVDIKYNLNPKPLPIPTLKYITDGIISEIGNNPEVIVIAITDDIPRNKNITFYLSTTILSKIEWFDKVIYKGKEYTPSSFSTTPITIIAGDLQTSPIQFIFKDIPFAEPFSSVNSIQVFCKISNIENAEESINDIITIVRTQDSNDDLEINITLKNVSCNASPSTPDGQITIDAIGGSGIYTYQVTNKTTQEVLTKTENVFSNLSEGQYEVSVYDTLGFLVQEVVTLTKAIDFTILNTISNNATSTVNGSIRIDVDGEGLFQYRLYNNNGLIEQSNLIDSTTYTFNIPDSMLPIVVNTATLYEKYENFKIEVYNPDCGTKTKTNVLVANSEPMFVVGNIICETISGENTGNRINNTKDINYYSLSFDTFKKYENGNIIYEFYDINETLCPINNINNDTFTLISGNGQSTNYIPFTMTIKYNLNGVNYTITNNNSNFGNVMYFTSNRPIIINVSNPTGVMNITILEYNNTTNVNTPIFNYTEYRINTTINYTISTVANNSYKIILANLDKNGELS